MRFVPAIDLKDGRCVRLLEGRADSETVYADDPGAQARAFVEAGARWIHVVDLDGAFEGRPKNADAIAAIVAAGAKVQLGGGLRDLSKIAGAFEAGATRVVLGTVAVTDPDLLAEACRRHPDGVIVSVDARDGEVAVEGWVKGSGQTAVAVASAARDAGAAGVLHTDISRDGTGKGVNVDATAELAARVRIPVIASGGVRDLADLDRLAEHPGIEGVVVGRALYEGHIDVAEACRRHRTSTLLLD
jgi:phosphoribosylformimino-5-aminoimidazole carboxamide ribotide isomerase